MSDDSAFLEMIESIRRLDRLPEEAARLATPLLLEAAKATAKAGQTPYGESWVAKKDGSRPLEHAADHITGVVSGLVIRLTLKGVDVIHNFGTQLGAKRTAEVKGNADRFVEKLNSAARKAHAKAVDAAKKAGTAIPEKKAKRSAAQRLGQYHTPPRQIIPSSTDPMPEAFARAVKRGADEAFKTLQETR